MSGFFVAQCRLWNTKKMQNFSLSVHFRAKKAQNGGKMAAFHFSDDPE